MTSIKNSTTVSRYWASNSTKETTIEFTHELISRFLVFDWLPHLPSIKASDFMGWPALLTESYDDGERKYLGLQSRLDASERQWGGFLSWMIGVAATRHVLESDGYQWVAPASAFYLEARKAVSIGTWPKGLIPGTLVVRKGGNINTRLRPDYLAVRRGGPKMPWQLALVEAKGTQIALDGRDKCPADWQAQVRNAEVWSSHWKISVSRHLVVATRSNPRAKRPKTRRFQIRVWNANEPTQEPDMGVVRALAVAQLYGLAMNINLPNLAEGIILGERLHQHAVADPSWDVGIKDVAPKLLQLQGAIDQELRQFGDSHRRGQEQTPIFARIGAGAAAFHVAVQGETASLMRQLATRDSVSDAELDSYSQEIANRPAESSALAIRDEAAPVRIFPGLEIRPARSMFGQLEE
jgi:hypothetical protein